jgi:hypothetical protein
MFRLKSYRGSFILQAYIKDNTFTNQTSVCKVESRFLTHGGASVIVGPPNCPSAILIGVGAGITLFAPG